MINFIKAGDPVWIPQHVVYYENRDGVLFYNGITELRMSGILISKVKHKINDKNYVNVQIDGIGNKCIEEEDLQIMRTGE